VVRDPAVHREVLGHTSETAQRLGLQSSGLIASPILGPAGNREFLLHLRAGAGPGAGPTTAAWASRIEEVVAA
jgi:23S rRNA (cytidine1920-2'-O)/16S rRNA (cytidine1409-2'-O)-methyltransferase